MLSAVDKGKNTNRELRVMKRGDNLVLRECAIQDVQDGQPTISPFQPGIYQECSGKTLPDLYEQAIGKARQEIEKAMKQPVVEEK